MKINCEAGMDGRRLDGWGRGERPFIHCCGVWHSMEGRSFFGIAAVVAAAARGIVWMIRQVDGGSMLVMVPWCQTIMSPLKW